MFFSKELRAEPQYLRDVYFALRPRSFDVSGRQEGQVEEFVAPELYLQTAGNGK